ncbi:odorant receptor 131-2-like [Discoglossus pictus]
MASVTNSTVHYSNTTQVSISSRHITEIAKLIILVLLLLFLLFFLYFISVLLTVYFTTSHVRENARYVLFAHMLINDTLYVFVSAFLLLGGLYLLCVPVPICFAIVNLASSTFRVTPYNLAAMSLERYVAICHPLRHAELCSGQRSNQVIAMMWVVALIPNVADFIALSSSVQKSFFSLCISCRREHLTINQLQVTIRSLTLIINLLLVAMIIVYTYIKIMLVALKTGSGKSSVFKAGKTVMLHALQLLLCMTSFASTLTETHLREQLIAILPISNFILFMCLPRLLSPLIYGIRDEVFQKCIKKLYIF